MKFFIWLHVHTFCIVILNVIEQGQKITNYIELYCLNGTTNESRVYD